jgi:hypothetical protein
MLGAWLVKGLLLVIATALIIWTISGFLLAPNPF